MPYVPSEIDQAFRALFADRPVILAPMEDVSDAVFRRLCRDLGAELCVTEFVNVEGLLRGCRNARRKISLDPDDKPTAIQIYGSDPARLAEAARVAEAAAPSFIDINCGCWVPKIAGRGAGAAWLRDPAAMVAMAKMVVESVSLPVTVKTRIGYGPESHMPIVDLAPRLEDVGVRALTIHCRTANMGHSGPADWTWAEKAQARVSMPVIVNGDIKSADDAARAMAETGCAGVMVGRRAIDHPWIFREARALLDRGERVPEPSPVERLELCRTHLRANVAQRGEPRGVHCTRRHLPGYLRGLPGAAVLRQRLNTCESLEGCLAILDEAEAAIARGSLHADSRAENGEGADRPLSPSRERAIAPAPL
jgi:nifR3 family TIM-barrel protein